MPNDAFGGSFVTEGAAISPHQRDKLKRLSRYMNRLPITKARLALTAQGQAPYCLQTPYRDGLTRIVLEPVDFMT